MSGDGEHQGKYRSPVEDFDLLIYTGSGLKGGDENGKGSGLRDECR